MVFLLAYIWHKSIQQHEEHLKMSTKIYCRPINTIIFKGIYSLHCRSQWPHGLRPLTCWDCGFESHRMSVVSVVCCQVEVSARAESLVQRSPTDCDVSRVWSRNLVNEEALAHWGGGGCRAKNQQTISLTLKNTLCSKLLFCGLLQVSVHSEINETRFFLNFPWHTRYQDRQNPVMFTFVIRTPLIIYRVSQGGMCRTSEDCSLS